MSKRPETLEKHGADEPRRRWPLVLVVLLGLAVAGKAGDWAVGRSADRRWEQFRELIAATGQPFTLEEIERSRVTLPPEQNSALLLERLRPSIEAAFAVPPPEDVLVFSVGDDLIDGVYNKNIAPSKAFLTKQLHIHASLEPLVDMPSGKHSLDLSQPPIDAATPNFKFAHDAARLAELASIISLLDRQREEAVRNALIQFAIAGSFAGDPRLMGRIIQSGCSNQAVHSVRQLLRTGFLSESALASLEQAIEARLASDTLRWSLLGERAYWMSVMDAARTGTRISSDPEDELRPLHWSVRWLPGRAKWIVYKNQIRGATWIRWLLESGENRIEMAAALDRIDQEYDDADQAYLVAKEIGPDTLRCFTDMHFRAIAELRAARAALAAERYRIEFNKLPESFEDLVPAYLPAIPLDPFADGPLQLKTTSEGIAIVSALMDDGSGANPPSALADADGSAADEHTGHDHGDHGHAGHGHGDHDHDGHDHGTAAAGSEAAPHRHVRPPRNIGVTVYDARFRGIMTIGDD